MRRKQLSLGHMKGAEARGATRSAGQQPSHASGPAASELPRYGRKEARWREMSARWANSNVYFLVYTNGYDSLATIFPITREATLRPMK